MVCCAARQVWFAPFLPRLVASTPGVFILLHRSMTRFTKSMKFMNDFKDMFVNYVINQIAFATKRVFALVLAVLALSLTLPEVVLSPAVAGLALLLSQ